MPRLLAALALLCALGSPALAGAIMATDSVATGAAWGVVSVCAIGIFLGLVTWWARPGPPVRRTFCALGAVFVLIFAVGPALAGSSCPQHYLDGQPPALVTPQPDATELCNAAFSNLWSPATRDPVYSAEHLTPAGITAADKTARLDAFHADERLPRGARAELSDYAGGDYDRGHLAPAHDMPTPQTMRQSFVLSNIIPQVPANNRGVWARIEEFTRRLVILANEGYVITGPIFDEHSLRSLKGRVSIPAMIFKAVYIPASQFGPTQVGAYVVANTADATPEIVSLDTLKGMAGIDPFPSLPAEMHARADLPDVAAK